MFGLGVPELLIILALVLLLFGGARLAGLGKSTGRALREFKEETKDLKAKDDDSRSVESSRPNVSEQPPSAPPVNTTWQQPAAQPPQPAGPPAGHHLNPPGEPPINTAWQQPPPGNVQDTPSGEVRRDS